MFKDGVVEQHSQLLRVKHERETETDRNQGLLTRMKKIAK